MKKRIPLCLLSVPIVLLAIFLINTPSLFASTPQSGGTLRLSMNVDIKSLDPHQIGWQNHEVLRQIYEGILAVDDGFGIIPGLAHKWDVSADGLVYTFHMRKGVKFHNGKEMTADDVKATLDRLTVSSIKSKFETIAKTEATGPYQVTVTLSKPTATFLINLASPHTVGVMPKEEIERQGDNIQHPVGTGPFAFVEWVPDRHVKLKRFAGYWGGEGEATGTGGKKTAYVDEVIFRPMTERAVRVSALEAGDIDLVAIPSAERQRLSTNPNLVIVGTGPTFEFWNFWFNCKAGSPFADLNLRKAFAHAVNKQEMLLATTGGPGVAVNSPFPNFSFWYTKAHSLEAGPGYDPALAGEYLKKSAYKGETIKIITSKGYPAMDKQAVVAQARLKQVGINTELEYHDWSSLFEKYKSGDFDVVSYGYGSHADPDFFYHARMLSTNTFNGWGNSELDRLAEAARATTDLEKRKALYDQAQQILNDELPLLFTFSEEYFYGYGKKVHGFKPWGAFFLRIWDVWIEK
jgi:peptide/nickel transport system substrate-binding protein